MRRFMTGVGAWGGLGWCLVACSPAPSRLATTTGAPQIATVMTSSTATERAAEPAAEPSHELASANLGAPRADGLLPAGLCGFDPYLSPPCEDANAPRFAVVLGEFAKGAFGAKRPPPQLLGDLPVRPKTASPEVSARIAAAQGEMRSAEQALAAGKKLGLPAGYPLAVSYDDMPAADGRRAVAVVAGFFLEKKAADAYVVSRSLDATVVALGPADGAVCLDDYEVCSFTRLTVVEIARPSAAIADKDADAAEARLSGRGSASPPEDRSAVFGSIKADCKVEPGRLFLTNQVGLHRGSRQLAPVTCGRGAQSFVDWRNTRLESVVVDESGSPYIHQVIAVSCDSPTLARQPFGEAPLRVADVPQGGCRG